MSTLSINNGVFAGDILLTKRSGTVLTLCTDGKYVDEDVQFTLAARSGVAAADTATADVNVSPTGSRNISGVLGTKTITEPTSGFYIRLVAEGSGKSKVVTSGWLEAGSLGEASTEKTVFIPIVQATATVSGTNTVTPTATVSGSNVTLGNTNNGIAVTATGGGSATAAVTATTNAAGYAPPSTQLGTASIRSIAETTTQTKYISGVTIPKPASGSNAFAVTVPNGTSTQTITFTVDASGNVTIS